MKREQSVSLPSQAGNGSSVSLGCLCDGSERIRKHLNLFFVRLTASVHSAPAPFRFITKRVNRETHPAGRCVAVIAEDGAALSYAS